MKRLAAENVPARRVSNAREALEAVREERFSCMILDLSLPDMDGLDLLELVEETCGPAMPSVVVYTARALSKAEAKRLEAYTEAIVVKEGPFTERLMNEVRLFARRLREGVAPRRVPTQRPHPADVRLEGKSILVVDDDMRTVYALSATLRAKGAVVRAADTGQAALDALAENPRVDAVLMDIMMPEMDGYEAMRRIRRNERFRELPIIALTAKAMKGDEDKCREAGASDYLPKPVDAEQLLALLHARLSREPTDGA
jgi:CheY-like chemotaxis protein